MNEMPHAHPCGSCGREVDCRAAREGGCIFQPSTGMTCDPCVALATGHDPEAAKHLCECTAPDPPREGAICGHCRRHVALSYHDDRRIDLDRLGR